MKVQIPDMSSWRTRMPFQRQLTEHFETEQHESLLNSSEKSANQNDFISWNSVTKSPATSQRIIGILGVVAVISVFWFSLPASHQSAAVPALGAHYLHLVVPGVVKPDSNVCKTILTAQVLNYPIPTITLGDSTPDGAEVPVEERPMRQMKTTFEWLENQPINADDNIVILLDGPTTWFQLRPAVLLQRYHDLIRAANHKLDGSHKTSIIFPAQKDCAATASESAVCEAVTQSPLLGASTTPHLGWGAMVGPVGDLRALFQRALNKAVQNKTTLTDPLPIFSEIFGEQEVQRVAARQGHWLGRTMHDLASGYGVDPADAARALDFGIALDYDGQLGFPTTTNADGTKWGKPSVVSPEVADSMPPYWTVSNREAELPNAGWSDVDLLSCPHTDVVPAMVHFARPSTPADNETTTLLEQLWPRHWVQPYARPMYTAAQRLPAAIVAVEVQDHFGHPRVYWNKMLKSSRDKAGAFLANGTWLGWDWWCGDTEIVQEVFRDTLPKWRKTDW